MSDTLPPVIALYSPCSGMGKSTACNYVLEHARFKVQKLSFADSVRELLDTILLPLFPSDGEEFSYFKEKKDVYVPYINSTYRQLLIHFGTDFCRTRIHADYWVQLMEKKVKQYRSKGYVIVIDDLRFPNEYFFLKEKLTNSFVGRIIPGLTPPSTTNLTTFTRHAADGLLDNMMSTVDFTLNHSSGIKRCGEELLEFITSQLQTQQNK